MYRFTCISVLFVLSFAAGCYHARIVAASNAKDFGDVVRTRFRYRLVIDEKDDKPSQGMSRVHKFRQYQPDVFGDDGIPVKVSHADILTDESGDWTSVLAVFSCGMLPAAWKSHLHRRCRLDVGGQYSSTVEICAKTGSSFALSPFPLLIFSWDDDSCYSSARQFKVHNYADSPRQLHQMTPYQDVDDMAMAYGIAAQIKEAEDSGKIDEKSATVAIATQSLSDTAYTQAKLQADRITRQGTLALHVEGRVGQLFEIVHCDNEGNKDFAYVFSLRKIGEGGLSLSDSGFMRTAFRSAIRSHYVSLHPNVNPRTLVVDFTRYEMKDGIVSGRVAVLTISPESIAYDSATRKGVVRVRIGEGQFDDARRWIRRNLATIATGSNVDFSGDAVPQGARFYSESEEMADGVLSVSFKTE